MSYEEDDWNYYINLDSIEESFFDNFDKCLRVLHEDIYDLLKDGQIKTHKYNYNSNNNENYDEELKRLIERNKEARQNIDLKLEDISKQQIQYENFKKGTEQLNTLYSYLISLSFKNEISNYLYYLLILEEM